MAQKKDEAASAPQKDLLAPAAGGTAADASAPAHTASDVARFEQALDELERIVAKLERGELTLEESLALFERGMQLTQQCRRSLDTAELKVQQLLATSVPPGDASA